MGLTQKEAIFWVELTAFLIISLTDLSYSIYFISIKASLQFTLLVQAIMFIGFLGLAVLLNAQIKQLPKKS